MRLWARLMAWREMEKLRVIRERNLLKDAQRLQEEISLAYAGVDELEIMRDLVLRARTFNEFVRSTVRDGTGKHGHYYLVFYGSLESKIAAIENLMSRKNL